MWKGRVWTERSALRLLRRRAAKFAHSTPEQLFDTPSSKVEGAWGGCWDPSLEFSENRRCRGGVPTSEVEGVST